MIDAQVADQIKHHPTAIVFLSDVAMFWEIEETGELPVKPVDSEMDNIEGCAVRTGLHQLDLVGPQNQQSNRKQDLVGPQNHQSNRKQDLSDHLQDVTGHLQDLTGHVQDLAGLQYHLSDHQQDPAAVSDFIN